MGHWPETYGRFFKPVAERRDDLRDDPSFGLLAAALKTIPIGTGYAVWTGIGAAGTAVIGMVFLGELREVLRIVCIAFVVAGVIGLASASGH